METPETIVMSVGGSLIVPDEIDTNFLHTFKALIETETAHGRRFIIITGGGRVCRKYQDAARAIGSPTNDDLDWIGINTTQLNGRLLHAIFNTITYPEMIINPEKILEVPTSEKVVVATGYRPGTSSDYRAVQIAQFRQATRVINLSNTDYVYTADPKVDASATLIEDITWAEFRKLIPEEWDPGLSVPFDPIAAKLAEENNIEVANINGARLDELKKYLNGEPFVGTLIHP